MLYAEAILTDMMAVSKRMRPSPFLRRPLFRHQTFTSEIEMLSLV
jgi:hypothetical protein